MCDPTYTTADGVLSGAMPGAPISGAWFHNQFVALVNNAYPDIATASAASVALPPRQVPAATRGLTATVGDSTVKLSWSAVSGAASYTVQRRAGTTGALTTVSSNVISTAYVDRAVVNGAVYVVTANNAAGASAPSALVIARPNK